VEAADPLQSEESQVRAMYRGRKRSMDGQEYNSSLARPLYFQCAAIGYE